MNNAASPSKPPSAARAAVVSVVQALHDAAQASFAQPMAMLLACHERVGRMLHLLERLDGHVRVHGADAQSASAARDVMRYFDLAGPAHHEDEERHILPRLRQQGQQALASRLQGEHLRMVQMWAALRPDLQALADAAPGSGTASWPALPWQAFAELYRTHIALEEAEAYPAVAAAAQSDERARMGAEMAARRGLPSAD